MTGFFRRLASLAAFCGLACGALAQPEPVKLSPAAGLTETPEAWCREESIRREVFTPRSLREVVEETHFADPRDVATAQVSVDEASASGAPVITRTQELRWDPFGNLLAVKQSDPAGDGYEWVASYDAFGRRLTTAERPVRAGAPAGAWVEVASSYDPLVEFLEIGVSVGGRRALKVYGPDGSGGYGGAQGVGGLWVWGSGGEPAAELNAAGDTVTKRFYGQGEVRRIESGPPASPSFNLQSFYYTRDHLGSVREVFDATNTVVARYDYDAYGRRTSLPVSGLPSQVSSPEFDFGYTGHLTHTGSGLVLTLFRAYDPETGRWLSRDPIWERGGLNMHAYVGGSPLMATDPLGLNSGIAGAMAIMAEEAAMYAITRAPVLAAPILAAAKVASDPAKVQQCVAVADAAAAGAGALANGENPIVPMALAYAGGGGRAPGRAATLPNTTRGWKVGDTINNLTRVGNVPSWSTVRARIWKNEAFYNASAYPGNVQRMQSGLAPQRINDVTGKVESMTFHHEPPQ